MHQSLLAQPSSWHGVIKIQPVQISRDCVTPKVEAFTWPQNPAKNKCESILLMEEIHCSLLISLPVERIVSLAQWPQIMYLRTFQSVLVKIPYLAQKRLMRLLG